MMGLLNVGGFERKKSNIKIFLIKVLYLSNEKIALLIFVFTPLVVLAQLPFKIRGLGGFNNGDKIFMVYKVNNRLVKDSAIVVNHNFLFKGMTSGIYPGYICRNENPDTAAVIHDAINLYIEPGNILITTADSLKNATLSGTSTNNDLYALNAALKPYMPERIKIETEFDALTEDQLKDINTIAPLKSKLRVILLKMAAVQFAFIQAHPNSYVSLSVLQQTVNNEDLLQQNNAAFNSLSASVKATDLGIKLKDEIASQLKTAIGATAINFELNDSSGRSVKLSDFKGKYVLNRFLGFILYALPRRSTLYYYSLSSI